MALRIFWSAQDGAQAFKQFRSAELARDIAAAAEATTHEKNGAISFEKKIDSTDISNKKFVRHREQAGFEFRQKRSSQQVGQPPIKGDFFDEYSESSYHLEPRFYALRNTSKNRRDYPNALEKNGYLIIAAESFSGDDFLADEDGPKAVVKNAQTGALGVFTGVLKVKLFSFENLDALADNYAAQVREGYPEISVGLLQFDSYEEALMAYKSLREHPWIQRVNVEVLEHERSKL